jgi:hypothetical protein
VNPLLPEPGDPVWVPGDHNPVRGWVNRHETLTITSVRLSSGKFISVKRSDLRFRYEKGEP